MPAELWLVLAAFVAGCIDAIIGGGGLVQLPALLTAFPTMPPAWFLGTNKLASIFGTTSAALGYLKRLTLDVRFMMRAGVLAFFGALIGSISVSNLSPAAFKPLVPVLLTAVLIYALTQRSLGQEHAPITRQGRSALVGLGLFIVLGFYDGFFGPGSGSLMMLVMVRYYGYDFLHAAGAARLINITTNLASLLWFGSHGSVDWALGLMMAMANILGALLGTRLAIRGGTRWVRIAFIGIVGALIAKTTFDAVRLWGSV